MKNTVILILLFTATCISCKKQDEWLNIKSSKSDVIPSTLEDYRALLDNTDIMNAWYPSLGMLASDNYYVTSTAYNALSQVLLKNAYVWDRDIYQGDVTIIARDWNAPYQIIEYANIVLEGIDKIEVNQQNKTDWEAVKGSALFFRSISFYNLLQIYSKSYNAGTSDTDLGIPIRTGSDVNIPSVRATVQQSYQKIVDDLNTAVDLLPLNTLYKTRPSKAAAYALLGKTYLLMGNYPLALENSEKALAINNSLIDFNTLGTTSTISFPNFRTGNPEIIFYATATLYSTMLAPTQLVDTSLVNSYTAGDLRKSIFYRSQSAGTVFTGKYTGATAFFAGLATNELYLVKAECKIRLGKIQEAVSDLSLLLGKRWNKNIPPPSSTPENETDALRLIISERRKEMPFTAGTRWEDLRRFNLDSRFATTLKRVLNGTDYVLPPNDPRYVFFIPPSETTKSHIRQND